MVGYNLQQEKLKYTNNIILLYTIKLICINVTNFTCNRIVREKGDSTSANRGTSPLST